MDIFKDIIETFVVIGALGTIISTALYIITTIFFNIAQRLAVKERTNAIMQRFMFVTTNDMQKGASIFILLSILIFISLFLLGLIIILIVNR